MKHAGRPRRGVTRQGREKRRRRNEASVEARDEEPGPIGTCTPTNLFGGAPGVVSGPHRRSYRASAHRDRQGVGGRPMDETHGPPRTGSRRREGAVAPLGERPRRITGRARAGLDAMGRSRPPGDREEAHLRMDGRSVRARHRSRTSVPDRRQAPGAPATPRQPGLHPQVACRAAAHRSFQRGRTLPARRTVFYGNRFVGGRAGTGMRTTESVPTQRSRLRAAGRNTAARRPHGRTRDLAPGSELSRVGALEGRRTSWEDAWERPVGVDRTASRPISGVGP